MAKVTGGITGRVAGTVGGLIFGAARTREGKAVTVRQKVDPSNPRTPAQQQQRTKFQQSLQIVRALGPSIYKQDWNRSIGQLAGFQSMMSIFLNALNAQDVLTPPPPTPLGDLYTPADLTFTIGGAQGQIDATYSIGNGANGTALDEVVILAIEADNPAPDARDVEADALAGLRQDGSATISGLSVDTTYVCAAYFRGVGTAEGLLSVASWGEVVIP